MRVCIEKGDDVYDTTLSALNKIKKDIVSKLKKKKPKEILLKPNLLVPYKTKACCTDADSARATMDFLNSIGKYKYAICEGSFTRTHDAFKTYGFTELEKEYNNVRIINVDKDASTPTLRLKTLTGEREVNVSKTALKSKFIVSLAKMKTHNHCIITLSIKNMMGTLVKKHKALMHGGLDPAFFIINSVATRLLFTKEAYLLNYNLVQISEALYPDLAIIDGIFALEGKGPGGSGVPKEMGLVVTSTDPIAADIVSAKIMCVNPNKVSYLRYIKEKKPGKIEVIGSKISNVKQKFKLHYNYKGMVLDYKKFKQMFENRRK